MTKSQGVNGAFLMLAILLISFNLRPAIAAIGPLTAQILSDTEMGSTGIGLLTTLPVFLMGLAAMSVRRVRRALGEKMGIGLGALVIAGACAARMWFPTGPGLLVTAAGAGVGIAIVQALVPGFIKRNFAANTGRAIGLYSTAIVAGAAVGSASAAMLADRLGWASALAFWAIPAFLAMALWMVASRNAASDQRSPSGQAHAASQVTFWRNPRGWSLLIFFAVGTGAFVIVVAWLPPFYVELGQSPKLAGYLLGALTIIEAFTALGVAVFVHHFPDRRGPLITSLVLVLAGLACLLLSPILLAIPAVILLGVGIGILFPLSIIVSIDHVNDPTLAGDLTAFTQGGGYMAGSVFPLVAGALRDAFGSLSPGWLLMAAGIVAGILLVLRYSPQSYLEFRRGLTPAALPNAVPTRVH
ncbi:MFS transporter [Mesorhizobium sp. BR1-1-9]|uniref:MFS transporter n=1 Tax=unclassified Mesorhizobium TaxID=325217 RepID=UPI001CD11956|nr:MULTISPECIES: MFS transporter [unclassified Mesorhizobium]MBZ9870304.1 MFS transporter [Mesorhizobium sp. BR1-1-9]MBZ9942266.1 MFS transporter [Mesorhizobium sp. BR1-1-13]